MKPWHLILGLLLVLSAGAVYAGYRINCFKSQCDSLPSPFLSR